ncbi:MAG: glycerol-3-phosphate 1-O-acyltransferase PlsY [Spirochaetaceae bacterium]|nr:glycerol-3-phosphate 1-O-acyltransferase PlsY [Spirochaetaceae bacterium]MDT8297763.1 glycerol-3-phosphate 1-O-acyltransferase PlsY [Spirochaetaceae bacterium]
MMSLPIGLSLPIILLAAYLVGSLPFALIFGRIFAGIDIREKGSGNAGATNVYRVLGWKAAAAVLVLDLMKGFLPVFLTPVAALSAGEADALKIGVLAAVVIGHAYPLWAGFRGGKGVASSAGGITALYPIAAPFCLAVFAAVLAVSSYVFLASLVAAWILPFVYLGVTWIRGSALSVTLLIFFCLIPLGITWLHRKNIRRLIRGEETKFHFKKVE